MVAEGREISINRAAWWIAWMAIATVYESPVVTGMSNALAIV
jgi:hypothetical protein